MSEQDCHDIINDREFGWTFPTHEEDDQHQVHVRIILEGGDNDVEEEDIDAL
jgi:hypothetical protein